MVIIDAFVSINATPLVIHMSIMNITNVFHYTLNKLHGTHSAFNIDRHRKNSIKMFIFAAHIFLFARFSASDCESDFKQVSCDVYHLNPSAL